ncbi:unnamed protein product, partial [Meganyctiphanes norvegica]
VRKDCRCTCKAYKAPNVAQIYTGPSSGVVKLKVDADGNIERDHDQNGRNISCYLCQNKSKHLNHYDVNCGDDNYSGKAIRNGFGSCTIKIKRSKLNIESVFRNGQSTVVSRHECFKELSHNHVLCYCPTDNCNSDIFSYDNIVNNGKYIYLGNSKSKKSKHMQSLDYKHLI